VRPGVTVRRVGRSDEAPIDGLARVLVDCVEGGASVGFMAGFDRDDAVAFWTAEVARVASGARLLFVAEGEDGEVLGTVELVLDLPPNQPHRGEITKMLVHRDARRRGVGEALLRAAQDSAVAAGRSLLTLDTASADAERLYERLGWQRAGVIPDYALWPDGRFVDTIVFYKRLPDGP